MVKKQRTDLSVRVPLSSEEQTKFRNYAEAHSLNIGRFLRNLIIEKMNETQEKDNA